MNNTLIDKDNKENTNNNSKRTKKINLSMKTDYVFKGVFSKPGNEDVLIDFLESILNIEIKTIDILRDVALAKEAVENKYGIIDLRATLNGNTFVIIEMQVKNIKEYLLECHFTLVRHMVIKQKKRL